MTFAPVILRFATIHGLSGRCRFDLVVNLLSVKAIVDGEITTMGGDQWRPFLHVEDAARAIQMAMEAPFGGVRDQVFNVGSDEQVTDYSDPKYSNAMFLSDETTLRQIRRETGWARELMSGLAATTDDALVGATN